MKEVTSSIMSELSLTNIPLEEAFAKAKRLPLVAEAIRIIRQNVSSKFCYHSEHHTLDVIREALRFGLEDDLTHTELHSLVVAAAWHDVGFMFERENHEELSVRELCKANETLSESALTEEQINLISKLILDTRLYKTDDGVVQIPTTELSKYLLDADLSNLGREDFFDCLDLLCMEHQAETYQFYRRTLGFITRHTWHTDVAKNLRLRQEILNTSELARRIMDERYLLAD